MRTPFGAPQERGVFVICSLHLSLVMLCSLCFRMKLKKKKNLPPPRSYLKIFLEVRGKGPIIEMHVVPVQSTAIRGSLV